MNFWGSFCNFLDSTIYDNIFKISFYKFHGHISTFFYRSFGIRIAIDGKIAGLLQDDGLLYDYESLYQTKDSIQKNGPRPLISANFQNITKLSSISSLLLNHPLFGKK